MFEGCAEPPDNAPLVETVQHVQKLFLSDADFLGHLPERPLHHRNIGLEQGDYFFFQICYHRPLKKCQSVLN